MEKFTLELLFQIIGIGSASGLIYKSPSLYVIGDNSGYLYEYNMEAKDLQQHAIIENASANIAKKDKPDFEAITSFEDKLYVEEIISSNLQKDSAEVREVLKKYFLKPIN